jgi:hypothetical protein
VGSGDSSRLSWSGGGCWCGRPLAVIGGWAIRVVDKSKRLALCPQPPRVVPSPIPSCRPGCTHLLLAAGQSSRFHRSGCGLGCGFPVFNSSLVVSNRGRSCAQLGCVVGRTAGHPWGHESCGQLRAGAAFCHRGEVNATPSTEKSRPCLAPCPHSGCSSDRPR